MIETGLFRTDRWGTGKGAHHHIVFIDTNRNVGELSTNNNHTHALIWQAPIPPQPGQPAQIDPQTGAVITPEIPPQPAQPGSWIIQPAGKDEHTHQIEPYSNFEGREEEEESDSERVKKVIKKFRACKQYEKESRDAGYEAEDFYDGEQWTESERSTLESQGRACITDNDIGPAIDNLRSFEIEQRSDFKYRPVESGDQRTAELCDMIAKNISDQNEFNGEQSEVFLDSAVVGKGVFGISWDKSKGVSGEVELGKRAWDEVHFGPHNKRDASDCQILCAEKWMTKDELVAFWGKKADEINETWETYDDLAEANHFSKHIDDGYNYGKSTSVYDTLGPDMVDINNRQVNMIECWEKTWREESVATIESAEYALNVWEWDKADIEALKTMPSVKVLTKPVCRAKVTTVAGSILLNLEDPADIPPVEGATDYFPFIPIYCYRRRERYWGKVEWNKDRQRQVNKRKSQAIDIGNRMASYVYLTDSETFADDSQKEKFRKNSMTPGAMLDVANLNRPPIRQEGVKFPAELVQLMQLDKQEIQQALNVIAQPTGANQSAANLMQQQRMKLAGNEFLFDSLRQARRKIGKYIIAFVQKHYTPMQIWRLVKDSSAVGVGPGGQLVQAQFTPDEIEHILNTQDLTKYDLAIDDVAFSSTIRQATSIMILDMMKAGVQFPPKAAIEINDAIPRHIKQQIYEMMDQQANAQKEEADAKMKMELGKTLVAHSPRREGAIAEARQPEPATPPPPMPQTSAMPMPIPVPPQAQLPMPVPVAQAPVMPPSPMMPMMPPPQPVNIDVNVNINDKGKRVVTLGPIGQDGEMAGTIMPIEETEPTSMTENMFDVG